MKRIAYILFLVILHVGIQAQPLRISVFNDFNIKSFVVSVFEGSYELIGDSSYVMDIDENNVLYFSFIEDKINLRQRSGGVGYFEHIRLKAKTRDAYVKIKTVVPSRPDAYYEENIDVFVHYDKMLIVNEINMSKYIAGVMEAECGAGWPKEFYKAHAVITRTYAYKNKEKHLGEGFNLCDGVHCQVFKGKCTYDYMMDATRETAGEVIIDEDTTLITAAFHSNCGGETQNAQQVWLTDESYLQSVQDPYCRESNHARWTKKISVKEWKDYLNEKGIHAAGLSPDRFTFYQKHRKQYYTILGKKILLSEIRKEWGFWSTFFNITVSGNTLIFRGRGYGHGVGLCQEGAMEMAKRKHDYHQIINFYYPKVRIVAVEELFLR